MTVLAWTKATILMTVVTALVLKFCWEKIQFIVSWILNDKIKYKNYSQNSSGGDFAVTQKRTFLLVVKINCLLLCWDFPFLFASSIFMMATLTPCQRIPASVSFWRCHYRLCFFISVWVFLVLGLMSDCPLYPGHLGYCVNVSGSHWSYLF